MTESAYRSLPSVDTLLQTDEVAALLRDFSHAAVTALARDVLNNARTAIGAGDTDVLGERLTADQPVNERLAAQIVERAGRAWGAWPSPVINATGVVLHTNLGRAPLSTGAATAAAASASIYSDLEFDLNTGKRGSRNTHISGLISQVTGAEAGIVVNNNAAGVLLALASVVDDASADEESGGAEKAEVIVSRGEAVEIGGGFRIPDVMRRSGANLVEVGTTNRTYASDYESALTPRTAAILKVHPSNFTVEGFTHVPELSELVVVGKKHGIPVIYDLGSGCLVDTRKYGLDREPMVQESVSDGAALTLFSGDKLLGGPQAGLIAGEKRWVDLASKHPLARAVRIDKMTLSAMAATLVAYLKGAHESDIPIWTMISANEPELSARAEKWRAETGVGVVERGRSAIGGGSLPGQTLPTALLAIQAGADAGFGADAFVASLRQGPVAVVARIENDRVLLDPRTVLPDQDFAVVEAIIYSLDRAKQGGG